MYHDSDQHEQTGGEVITGLILLVPLLMYWGFVFKKLWQWFIMPFGAVPITLPWAIGIMVIFSLFVQPGNKKQSVIVSMFGTFFYTSCLFIIGYIVSLFM